MLNVLDKLMKGLLFMKNKPGIYAKNIADTKTGTWRQEKPLVSDKCISCGICAKYCPGQYIDMEEIATIDYEYCKGCGICAVLCPVKAISMTEEEE